MLRELKCQHLGVEIFPFNIAVAGGVPSIVSGGSDFTAQDVGTGEVFCTFRRPFSRAAAAFFTRNDAAGAGGGYEAATPSLTSSTLDIETLNASGVLEDCGSEGFVVGFRSLSTNLVRPQLVKSSRVGLVVRGVQIDTTTPTVNIGKGEVTVSKAGTGDVTLTLSRGFSTVPICKVTPISAAGASLCPLISTKSTSGGKITIRILLKNTSGVLTDGIFNLIMIESLSKEVSGSSAGGPVQNTQRKPRLLVLRANCQATPSFTFGSEDATIADSGLGTGDMTITYRQPFRREPIVVATGISVVQNIRCSIVSSSSSALRLQLRLANTTLADGDGASIFVLGSDDPSEY